MEAIQDIIAENFLRCDQRGALCLFIETDDLGVPGEHLTAEGFLMCKYPSIQELASGEDDHDACLTVMLKDGDDEIVPYLGAEEFITETHFNYIYDRKTPEEQGKIWIFDPAHSTRSHDWGALETVSFPGPAWDPSMRDQIYTIPRSVPEEYVENQLDTGVAKLGERFRIQTQFRLKHLEEETEMAYADSSIRFDLDEDGKPKEYKFYGGVAQYGKATALDPNYTGTMENPFWQRARLGAIWPGGYFWEDYYDDHKTNASDWYRCAWYDYVSFGEGPESYVYTITCWRYMDRRLGTWRYVCIDVSPDLEFNSHGFHSETAKLKFNKLQLNSVAPAEDLDMDPLAYLKEQEEA